MTGCITPVRASNRSFAPNENAAALFAGGPEEAVAWLSEAFLAEGYKTQRQYGKSPNIVYVFERQGRDVEGPIYWGRRGRAPAEDWLALPTGSIFYAYAKPATDGAKTFLALYGKPTVGDRPVCWMDDFFWNIPCVDIEASRQWVGRPALNGAAEAETARRIVHRLEARPAQARVVTPIGTFQPPSGLPPPPEVGEDCRWTLEDGHFQHLRCSEDEKKFTDHRFTGSTTTQSVPDGPYVGPRTAPSSTHSR